MTNTTYNKYPKIDLPYSIVRAETASLGTLSYLLFRDITFTVYLAYAVRLPRMKNLLSGFVTVALRGAESNSD